VAKKTEKKGGGKLKRTHMVTIRLDPRLRYLTDLAARTQRRTTSGFIEWAIEKALSEIILKDFDDALTSLMDEAAILWDIDETDRFLKLALNYPYLLTYDEQVMWRLLTKYVIGPYGPLEEIPSNPKETVYEIWEDLKAAASGDAEKIKAIKDLREVPF